MTAVSPEFVSRAAAQMLREILGGLSDWLHDAANGRIRFGQHGAYLTTEKEREIAQAAFDLGRECRSAGYGPTPGPPRPRHLSSV